MTPDELIAQAVKANLGFRRAAPPELSAGVAKAIECGFLYGTAAMVVMQAGDYGMGASGAMEMVALEIDTFVVMAGSRSVLP